jgi:hypothetical protein
MECHRRIGDRAGENADARTLAFEPRHRFHRPASPERGPPRKHTDDPAGMSRLTDASREIVPHRQWHASGGNQGRIPPTAATGSPIGPQRMDRASPNGIVGLVQIKGLGNVPLPQHHRPDLPQPGHDRCIGLVAPFPPSEQTESGAQATDGKTFFHAHRHAGKHPRRPIGQLPRLLAGGFESILDEGIEATVVGATAGDVVRHDIRGRSPTGRHRVHDRVNRKIT